MGLPSVIENFTLRFTEADQLEEPDQKMAQKWLAEVVREASQGFTDPFMIKGREQVTHDYLNGTGNNQLPSQLTTMRLDQ